MQKKVGGQVEIKRGGGIKMKGRVWSGFDDVDGRRSEGE